MRFRCAVTPSTSSTAYAEMGGSASASRAASVATTSAPAGRTRRARRAPACGPGCEPPPSGADATEVMAVAGVDLDLLADDHEQRHLDLRAGLQGGRLG